MESAALDTVLLAATLTVLALTGFMLFITLGAILPFSFVFVCVCVLSFFGAACVILPRPDRVPLSRDRVFAPELQNPARQKEDLLKIQQHQHQIVSGSCLKVGGMQHTFNKKDVERKTEWSGVTLFTL